MKKQKTIHKKHTEKKQLLAKGGTIVCLFLIGAIILFPVKGTPVLNEVEFVWNVGQLNGVHGAASQWDYLFEDDTKTYGGQLGTNSTVPLNTSPYPDKTNGPTSHYPNTTGTASLINQTGQNTQADQNTEGLWGGTLGGAKPSTGGTGEKIAQQKDCQTPRGAAVKHGDFTLAYEQRTDVEIMCNVEKRVCDNGTLQGAYIQQSCKEDGIYTYETPKVINYNEKIVDPFVQPTKPANAGADFSTEGKINQTNTPTTSWGSSNDLKIITSSGISQTTTSFSSCTTPRGSTIKNGQFVKAYKSSIGVLDVPCETELRLCIKGTLKGSFLNKRCTFKDITYNDYVAGNQNFTKPTAQDIQGTLIEDDAETTVKNYGIWDWIKGVFK